MRSRHHFPISALVGVVLVLALGVDAPAGVVLYAALLGTFVDLDHFLIARLRTGSWDSLLACLRDPKMALLDQSRIFETGDVGRWTRLGSHLVITATVGTLLALVAPTLALVSIVVLGVHIGCDLAWDTWRRQAGSGGSATER